MIRPKLHGTNQHNLLVLPSNLTLPKKSPCLVHHKISAYLSDKLSGSHCILSGFFFASIMAASDHYIQYYCFHLLRPHALNLHDNTFTCTFALFTDYWYSLQNKDNPLYNHEDSGDLHIVKAVLTCLASVLLCISCGVFAIWRRHKRIQDEKTKAQQETGDLDGNIPPQGNIHLLVLSTFVIKIAHISNVIFITGLLLLTIVLQHQILSDLRKEVANLLNGRPEQPTDNSDTHSLLPIDSCNTVQEEAEIPQLVQPCMPVNMLPTAHPKGIEGGAPHNEDNGEVDTDQTLVKTVESEPSNNPSVPSPSLQIDQQQGYNRLSMELSPPQSRAMYAVSVVHSDLLSVCKVPMYRAQGPPQVRITMPPSKDAHNAGAEESSTVPGQETPDTFVTSEDVTARSSMNHKTDDAHLYRTSVNQTKREELPQPVNNIPKDFGI